MNTQVHETTRHSQYELVFGQKPRTMQFADGAPSFIKEEDLEFNGVVFGRWKCKLCIYICITTWIIVYNISKDDHDHSRQKLEQDIANPS